jgi:hypothetical protein
MLKYPNATFGGRFWLFRWRAEWDLNRVASHLWQKIVGARWTPTYNSCCMFFVFGKRDLVSLIATYTRNPPMVFHRRGLYGRGSLNTRIRLFGTLSMSICCTSRDTAFLPLVGAWWWCRLFSIPACSSHQYTIGPDTLRLWGLELIMSW